MVKSVARFEKGGRGDVLSALEDAIHLLSAYDQRAQFILRERYRDHVLKGNRKGMRELHLAHDDLLLYLIIQEDNTVVLENIVTHEELRKRRP